MPLVPHHCLDVVAHTYRAGLKFQEMSWLPFSVRAGVKVGSTPSDSRPKSDAPEGHFAFFSSPRAAAAQCSVLRDAFDVGEVLQGCSVENGGVYIAVKWKVDVSKMRRDPRAESARNPAGCLPLDWNKHC